MSAAVSDHREFVSDDVERLLTANGLHSLEAAFVLGAPVGDVHAERAIRHDFKRVVYLDLATPNGNCRVYIKRQWRRERLLPRPTDIRHRIGIKCTPIHEWRGLRIMQQAGMDVSEPLAVFWRGWGFSIGAVVTRAVPVNRSLDDLINSGDFARMTPARRSSLINAAVNVVKRIEQARLTWRSMKAKHFYPEETGDGWRIWLIDCEGVSHRGPHSERQRQWNAFLQYITARMPELKDPFLKSYFTGSGD
jgi:hypothetical protein